MLLLAELGDLVVITILGFEDWLTLSLGSHRELSRRCRSDSRRGSEALVAVIGMVTMAYRLVCVI